MSQAGSNSGGGGSGGVTSVTGTAHQILATPTTGDVVLSFTNGISIGSFQSTIPPLGGIIAPGRVAFGTSTASTNAQLTISDSLAYSVLLDGTKSAVDANSIQADLFANSSMFPTSGGILSTGVYANGNFGVNTGQTLSNAAGVTVNSTYFGNAGTITNAYGVYVQAGDTGSGTITNAYGGYFTTPVAGSTNRALYADDLTLGTPLSVGNGGTGDTSFNTNGAVISNTTTTGPLQAIPLSSGQLLIGGTGAPAAANIIAGLGAVVTNGNNSITIAAPPLPNICGFAAFANTNQNCPASSTTVLNFGTTIYNNGSVFGTTTFTVPTSSKVYRMNAMITVTPAAVTDELVILRNGSPLFEIVVGGVAGVQTTISIDRTFILIAGDLMQVAYVNTSGAIAATVAGNAGPTLNPIVTGFEGSQWTA